jgi:O-succinylbenzoic acid--CoA ligase
MTPAALEQAWAEGRIVPLADPASEAELASALGGNAGAGVLQALQRQWGPGVVVGSGGSSGGRRWCLQPLSHLQASAQATAAWLHHLDLDPAACVQFNPLPLHHVSGLLPLVRGRLWGCSHRPIPPAMMRDPQALAAAALLPEDRPALISLVPTQLRRLMAEPEGLQWLQRFAVIWVGGAPLPEGVAAEARAAGLRLAPCYGATETAAMVCALPPDQFLAGDSGCGLPLEDVELRLEPGSGAIAVRTPRLSPGWLEQGELRPLPGCGPSDSRWWCSGDAGLLGPCGLTVLGRLDGALHSGAETVFPEVLEERLLAAAQAAGLPLEAVLLLATPDPEWGERLVALVRPTGGERSSAEALLAGLAALSRTWRPAERPSRWVLCWQLAPSGAGKWQRRAWQQWLRAEDGASLTGGESPG